LVKREIPIELGVCGLSIWMLITAYFASSQGALANAGLKFGIPAIVVLLSIVLLGVGISPPKIQNGESKAALDRYRSMLDNLPVGVYRSASDGRILEANRTFARMLGYENTDELKKVDLNDVFVRKSDRVGQLEKLRDSTVFAEFQLRRKDGETVWVRDYPKATLAPTGNVDYQDGVIVQTHGIEAIVRDITEHRRLEIMKDQFISSVTHELRTPLVSIKGYVDYVLAEDPKATLESVKTSIEVVKRNTDRLLELTNDLLDVQRMESGKLELKIQNVNFRDLIKECVEEIQPLIRQKNQHLHLEIPAGPLTIQGDHLRLSQVMMNLLNNATKFTPTGGDITVRAEEEIETGDLRISVKDTGIGINKSDIARVFEPFAAIEKATYYKGTGLGLSLTKKLVEAHGGTISAFSPGKGLGTTFTFTLLRKRIVELHG